MKIGKLTKSASGISLILLLTLSLFCCGFKKTAKLKVISIEPKTPATLEAGQKLLINFEYDLGPYDSVLIWARPQTNGQSTPGYAAHPSPVYKKSVNPKGKAQGYFFFDRPTKVDEIVVRMSSSGSKGYVCTTTKKCNFEWKGTSKPKEPQVCGTSKPKESQICGTGRPAVKEVKFRIVDESSSEPLADRKLNICQFVYFNSKETNSVSPYLDRNTDYFIAMAKTNADGEFRLDMSLLEGRQFVAEAGGPYEYAVFERSCDLAHTYSPEHIRIFEGNRNLIYDLKRKMVKIIPIDGQKEEEKPYDEITLKVKRRENPAVQVKQEKRVETVRWINEDTGQELFNIFDIVRFDWDKQIFELNREKAIDLLGKPTGRYRRFTVRSGADTIYTVTFVSMLSSIGFPGPAIVFDGEALSGIKPPLFKIDDSYPKEAKAGEDVRFSELLKTALKQADKLRDIDINNPPPAIEKVRYGWYGGELKVSAAVFPETFRLNELAKIHLRITGAKYLEEPNHIIDVNATLISNEGGYKYSAKRIFPARRDNGDIYVLGMVPWASAAESCADNHAKAGPAEVNIEIFTRKVLDEKAGLYSEPIDHIKIEPITIIILPLEKWVELTNEAKAVMNEFQQALKASDWEKALSCCSEKVKEKSKEYSSAGAFFNDVVPIDNIVSISEFNIGSVSKNRAGEYISFSSFLELSEPNSIQWLWTVDKKDTGWIIDFNTAPLKSQIEQKQRQDRKGRVEWEERDKKLKEGFRLSLIPLSENFVIGKPMLFRLEIQNISNEKLELGYFTESVMVNAPLEIKDSNGSHVPYMDTSYQTSGAPKIFEPNEKVVLANNYDVRSQYHIVKPGRYTFQFKGERDFGTNNSNIIEVDIKPGEMLALEEIVEKLKPVPPKGWELTRSMYPFGDLPEGETRKTIMFHLAGKYPPKASGGQRIALSIFVNPTPSFLEKKYFDAELWGESIWGPVYVKNMDAELLWPDYKEQIKNALNIQETKDKK